MAIWTNRFTVDAGSEVVRLIFGDEVRPNDAPAIYHTSVIMTRANAFELRDLLDRLLTQTEPARGEEAALSDPDPA